MLTRRLLLGSPLTNSIFKYLTLSVSTTPHTTSSPQYCASGKRRGISSSTTRPTTVTPSSADTAAAAAAAAIAVTIGFAWHSQITHIIEQTNNHTTKCEKLDEKLGRTPFVLEKEETPRNQDDDGVDDSGQDLKHEYLRHAKKNKHDEKSHKVATKSIQVDSKNEKDQLHYNKQEESTIEKEDTFSDNDSRDGILPEYRNKGLIPRRVNHIDNNNTASNSTTENSTKPFFSKEIWVLDTVPIRAHESVSDGALLVAADRLSRMLRHLPAQVKLRLRRKGAAFHIIGIRQHTSDLPEHSHLKGVMGGYTGENMTLDERTRGMGGVQSSCGEENLIDLDTDPRYKHKDILCHEFAHCIMDVGLPRVVRDEIQDIYNISVHEKKRWTRQDEGAKDAYAATNAQEYWAELSMWFFNSHGEFVNEKKREPIPGPGGLALYDPDGFELLSKVYTGTHPKLKETDPVLPHLVPLDSSTIVENGHDDTGDDASLSEGESKPASKSSTNHVTVEFDNRGCNCNWKLFWITHEGDRKQYGIVPQRGSFSQQTYTGHVWLLEPIDHAEIKNESKASSSEKVVVYSAGSKSGLARVSIDSGCSSIDDIDESPSKP